MKRVKLMDQGWYVQFFLKIELEILLRKTTARLNIKIDLGTQMWKIFKMWDQLKDKILQI